MLVLSRHRNESIYIGNDVVITVVDIRGDKIRLGITAPQDVSVDRSEVREAKLRDANATRGKDAGSDATR